MYQPNKAAFLPENTFTMKKIFYAFAAVLIFSFQFSICYAQSWQWAKRGGDKAGTTSDEEVRSIAIDKNGNSYTLAYVYSDKLTGDIDVDGNKLGNGNNQTDLCLISFDCSGKYRWSKIIGGRYSDIACDVKLDTLGGVYISGNLIASGMYDSVAISTDTIIRSPSTAPFRIYRSFCIIKFDTAGKYKWLRLPEPDSMSVLKNSVPISMEVDKFGNISLMTYINHSGAFCGGSYIVAPSTIPSLHILKYNLNGNFIKGFPLAISEGDNKSLSRLRMAWDYRNDVYYLLSVNGGDPSVSDQPKFGTTKMTGSNCLAKFSNTGVNLWVKQSSTASYIGITSVPKIDNDGNIYIGTSDKVGATFGGYTFTNTMTTPAVPVILKIRSSDGNVLWGQCVNADYSAGGTSVEISSNGTVGFATVSLRTISIGSFKSYSAGTSMNIAFIGLDKNTGAIKFFDTINASNSGVAAIIASDRNNNFYLGGNFDANLQVNGVGALSKYGGRNDFFIAKFGVADCKAPVSINENDLQKSIVKIYPNPAQDVITFEDLQSGSEVRLFNIMGQQMHSFVAKNIKEQVSINHLASGMYLVQIRNVDGEIYTAKIVKE